MTPDPSQPIARLTDFQPERDSVYILSEEEKAALAVAVQPSTDGWYPDPLTPGQARWWSAPLQQWTGRIGRPLPTDATSQPGDIVNGHVLGSDHVWHLMDDATAAQRTQVPITKTPSTQPLASRQSGKATDVPLPWLFGGVIALLALVLVAVWVANTRSATQRSTATSPSATPSEDVAVRMWVTEHVDAVNMGALCYASVMSVDQAMSTWADFQWAAPEFSDTFPQVSAQDFYGYIQPLCGYG